MARDWDKYEAEIREQIERKLAHAHERAQKRAERIRERAERHAERAAKSAEWYAEQAKKQAERQTERAKERFERASRRSSGSPHPFWNSSTFADLRAHGLGGGCDKKSHNEMEILFGMLILAVGAGLLFSNLGFFEFNNLVRFWPVVLIGMGMVRLTRAKFASAYGFGIFMVLGGFLFLFSNFGVIHASWNLFWPAILILIGLQHLLSNFDPPEVKEQRKAQKEAMQEAARQQKAGTPPPPPPVNPFTNPTGTGPYGPETPTSGPRPSNVPPPPPHQYPPFAGASASAPPPPFPQTGPAYEPEVHVHEYCIFTGGKRRIQTSNFRGGEIVAVFGGVDVDLRNSYIGGDEAVIDITAAFGGCTLRVPESWYVEMRGVAAFGGYSNKTIPPRLSPGQRLQKLVVTGSAAFGGVVIEN